MTTSDLNEFKKQLEETSQNNIIDLAGDLSEDGLNSIDPPAPPQVTPPRALKVPKNIVLAFASDASGCGFIRCHLPLNFLHFIFGKSQRLVTQVVSTFIFQTDILTRSRALYFQRTMAPQHVPVIRSYKENQKSLGYKMIYEIDDLIWWNNDELTEHGVPPYNFGAPGITEEVKKASIEMMKMMDLILVSTEYLAHYINNVLKVPVPTMVIPNYAARFFWKGGGTKKQIKALPAKPKFIYTGSPTHYSNEKRLYGDWENKAWRDFVIENVKAGKIDFTVMGGLPWFFEEIKDKIKVIDWVNSYSYHLAVMGERADFGLMPLTPNNFNRGKSDIKYVEYCAAGVVGVGCYFRDDKWPGPYKHMPLTLAHDCTREDIESAFAEASKVENYNKLLKAQNEFMEKEGRWLESPEYVGKWLKAFE